MLNLKEAQDLCHGLTGFLCPHAARSRYDVRDSFAKSVYQLFNMYYPLSQNNTIAARFMASDYIVNNKLVSQLIHKYRQDQYNPGPDH